MMVYRQSSAPVQPRFERLQAGRNQEVNSRLQMKADELERLFAEHKRRAAHREAEESSSENNSESTIACFRGELYERYMQKRELKLRKESKLKREEREATMKALRESLDRTTADLKLLHNLRSTTTMKRDRRDQVLQLVKNNFSEEEEEDEQSDHTSYKSVNSKLLPTKPTMSSSSVGRNSNSSLNNRAILPRPSAKVTAATGNSARGSGSKNSTADTRKENTKPSTTITASKPSTNLPRSKSTSTGLSSSSSTPSRKLSAAPLKPLTLPVARAEKPKSAVASETTNSLASISEAAAAAAHDVVDVPSPTASTASSGRARKKWASVTGSDASCQPPRKDTGIKRFLQFGRKKKKGAESVDAECSPAGARAAASEVMSKSRTLEYQVPCRDGFSDHGAIALEQVQTRESSMAAASPANYKMKEDQSPRGVPRSFFSLPPFRNREGDSKLGR